MTADPPSHRDWRLRPIPRWRAALLALAYALILVPLARTPHLSGNVFSRYMTVESIVERHTLRIDGSPLRAMSGSPDVVLVKGHWYSDKPPVLSALAAAIYAPLVATDHRFHRSPIEFGLVNWVLVLTFSAFWSAVAVFGVRRMLQAADLPLWVSDLAALAFGLGSPLLTWAVTFNNHSVAAGLLMASGLLALEADRRGSTVYAAGAGFLASLAATIDLPAGALWTALVGLALASRFRRWNLPVAFALGTLAPIAFHVVLQMRITGSPLPVELTPEVFDYEGSYWRTPEGRWVEPGPRWRWGIEFWFGPNGWITVLPSLAVGLYGLVRTVVRRGDPLRPAAVVVGTSVVVLSLFYTFGVRRTDFAGWSFGARHMLAITPPVWAFAVIAASQSRRGWLWAVLVPLLLVGALYAWVGQRDPWSRVERRPDPELRWVRPLTLDRQTQYQR
jgi:hypothetical protein